LANTPAGWFQREVKEAQPLSEGVIPMGYQGKHHSKHRCRKEYNDPGVLNHRRARVRNLLRGRRRVHQGLLWRTHPGRARVPRPL